MTGPIATSHAYEGVFHSDEDRSRRVERTTIEFVGASDDTIADAVRRALATASRSLQTLEGVGVLVIPQVYRDGPAPRYRVTLQITAPDPYTPDPTSLRPRS